MEAFERMQVKIENEMKKLGIESFHSYDDNEYREYAYLSILHDLMEAVDYLWGDNLLLWRKIRALE